MENTEFLKRNSKKEWFMCLLLGVFIGLAVIIPGISGATIAIIFGLHSKLLYSFENIFKKFKSCIIFLIPILLGIAIGFIFGFFVVQKVFDLFPFIVICLFAGLMIGSFPAVKDEIKGVKFDKTKIILFIIGVIVPIVIGIVSVLLTTSTSTPINFSLVLTALYFVMGFFMSLTQLVPGLSCSALLMALGQYGAIMATAKFDYIISNPIVTLPLISLVLGFGVGIIAFSKLINKLLEKKRDNTYCTIVGLSLGSIVSMFINPEVWSVYKSWTNAGVIARDLVIGVVLMAVGIVLTYLLVRYQRKKNLEKANEQTSSTDKATSEKQN